MLHKVAVTVIIVSPTSIFTLEHQNFFGIDDNLGAVAVSLRKEKLEENSPFTLNSPLPSPRIQYRFIVRTSEVRNASVLVKGRLILV